ncbi:MAG TPA: hypothetical protein VK773_08040 [Acidimicrobiales bacterium]|nr:hypothetical protein [Acidimicrobiales bacterium]
MVAVLAALLVGGLAEVSRQSQGYDAASNRTLAAQGTVVAEQSNATASSATALMNTIQSQNRPGLQILLDSLVQQTADESSRAAAAAEATPMGSVGADFAAAFADRAQSMSDLRGAIDGYLGMQPLPVAGSPTTIDSGDGGSTTLLTATDATNRIAGAGTLLAHSDALYRSVRHALRTAAGNGRLPRSVWVSNPQLWAPDAVASQIGLISSSPSLAAVHYLALRTVRVSPPALPTPQGAPANVSVLSPTTQISVNVVLANDGSVGEPHATVHYTMASQSSGATSSQTQTVALAPATSQALPTANFAVIPGSTYVLTVSVDVPAGQTQTAGTAVQNVLAVSPATCLNRKGLVSTNCSPRS